MNGDARSADADDQPAVHVDPISEVEAEVDAELPGIELGSAHRHAPHPTDADPGAATDAPSAVAPDTIGSMPAPNRRVGRQRFLVAYLRVALVVAFLVGLLELLLPEELRDEAAVVMVVVFVVAPIGRIVWLMIRWARLGDWRYALVGGALLGVVATGFLVR